MTQPLRAPRYHALDGVRAFAMLLGVFLHASLPYMHVLFPWAVVDGSRSVSLTLVIYAIHSFRMPAFFLIAGFFARLVFHRAGPGAFLKHRAKRVLLPLVAGWIVLYPLVRFLWVWSGVRTVPGADLAPALFAAFTPPFLGRGVGLIHLWFLYYLLLLYVFGLAARWFFVRFLDPNGHRRKSLDTLFERLVRSPLCVLGMAIPTACVLLLMRGWGVDFVDRSLVPRPAHILFYGIFFLFGWMLHRNPSLLSTLRSRWALHVGVASALLVPITGLLYLVYRAHYDAGLGFRTTYFLIHGAIAWGFVLGLLGAFQRFFDDPSSTWRYLADASYWIYLVHLPLVIGLSVVLRDWSTGWYLKLALVLAVSTPLLIGSYHLLVRSTWVGVVLNGRRLPRGSVDPDA